MFESGLKDNTSLGFAVITGCLRISKESIFTGLNHLNIVSVLSVNFEEYFGFTAGEVEEMCRHYDMVDQYATIREWYDGYTFGQTDIYNPWSVIKYIYDALPAHNWLPRSYWANTSSNQIVRMLIDRADDMERERLEGGSMKNVLLSADNAISIYAVPDEVADHLEEYCLEFSCYWLHKSPDAAKYRVKMGGVVAVRYDERDFVNYLNLYVCDTESVLVTTLEEVYDTDHLPEAYVGLPCFHF